MIGPIIYEPLKSQLRYNAESKKFEGHFAAVLITQYPLFRGGDVNAFAIWLHRMAQGNVAGGVVARKLLPTCDGGDQGDRREFEKFCDQLEEQNPPLKINRDVYWNRARLAVEELIESDRTLLIEIQQIARKLREEFGL